MIFDSLALLKGLLGIVVCFCLGLSILEHFFFLDAFIFSGFV